MYLVHNGTVRETPKAEVRGIETDGVQPAARSAAWCFPMTARRSTPPSTRRVVSPVSAMCACGSTEGELSVGDDIMLVLIGGDIRPRVIDALQQLVGTIKNECVSEIERPA